MAGMASLISHLGGKEISQSNLIALTYNTENATLQLHANAQPTNTNPVNALHPAVGKALDNVDFINPIPPPAKPKTTLKASNFFPIATNTLPPPKQDNIDAIEDNDEPRIYSTMLDGVGDGLHFITASFVKSNNKINSLTPMVAYM